MRLAGPLTPDSQPFAANIFEATDVTASLDLEMQVSLWPSTSREEDNAQLPLKLRVDNGARTNYAHQESL